MDTLPAVAIKISLRARRMRLTVYPSGELVATVPRGFSARLLDEFLARHARWIASKLEYFKKFGGATRLHGGRREYLQYKEQARALVQNRLKYFSGVYGIEVKKVSIKNQRTMWGSCSRKGNMNFNYKIVFLSERLADYVIVHELCHVAEFNHSRAFWGLVAREFPDHRELRRQLKRYSIK